MYSGRVYGTMDYISQPTCLCVLPRLIGRVVPLPPDHSTFRIGQLGFLALRFGLPQLLDLPLGICAARVLHFASLDSSTPRVMCVIMILAPCIWIACCHTLSYWFVWIISFGNLHKHIPWTSLSLHHTMGAPCPY